MADAPEQVQGEGLPRPIGPLLDRRRAEALEKRRDAVSPAAVATRPVAEVIPQDPAAGLVDHPPSGLGGGLVPESLQRVGLGDQPTQLRVGAEAERVLEHGQAQVVPRPHEADQDVGLLAEVVDQGGGHVVPGDPPPGGLAAVGALEQVGMAAVGGRAPPHRLVERQILEGVQRVVMHEDGNRSLRRQQVCRMLDQVVEAVRRPVPGAACPGDRLGSRCVSHVGVVRFSRASRVTSGVGERRPGADHAPIIGFRMPGRDSGQARRRPASPRLAARTRGCSAANPGRAGRDGPRSLSGRTTARPAGAGGTASSG